MFHRAPEPAALAAALIAGLAIPGRIENRIFLVEVEAAVTEALPALDPFQIGTADLAAGWLVKCQRFH